MDLQFVSEGIDKIYAKLTGWGEALIAMLPNLLIALFIVIVFYLLSRWTYSILQKGFTKTQLNKNLEHLLANIGRIAVLCLGLVFALSVLELQKTVFSLLAGVGVVGLALGFAFQDLAANFISGVMLAVRGPVNIGDIVEIGDVTGTVIELRLRETLIRNFDGQEVFVPNKDFTSSKFTNYSSFGKRRITLSVGVGYEDDPQAAVDLVESTLKSLDGILKDPAPIAYLEELGGSSVNVVGAYWIKFPGDDFLKLRTQGYVKVKKALEDQNFNIPFPIRTIDLPDSVVEKLTRINSELSGNSSKAKEGKEKNQVADSRH